MKSTAWHHVKLWKERVCLKEFCKKCDPQERNPCAPQIEDKTLQETLQQERCSSREAWVGLGKSVYKFNNKGLSHVPLTHQAWVMSAPSSKKTKEREFGVDFRASTRMLNEKVSSSAELNTLRKFRKTTSVITASGEAHASEEAQVYGAIRPRCPILG